MLLLLIFLLAFATTVSPASSSSSTTLTLSPNTPPSLSQAIEAASSGTVLQLGPGVYSGSQNCAIFLSSNKTLTLVGLQGPQNTIIDCANVSNRCLWIDGGATVNISGIQFRNGKAPNAAVVSAAARFVSSKVETRKLLPVRRKEHIVMVVQVALTMQGRFRKVNVQPLLNNNNNNTNRRHHRHNRQSNHKQKPTQRSNTSPDLTQTGGGCLLITNSSVVLENVVIFGCQALSGGGIAAMDSTISITDCTITQNGINVTSSLNPDVSGGGGYFANSRLWIGNSIVSSNHLGQSGTGMFRGGGMFFLNCNNTVIFNTTYSNNVIASSITASPLMAGAGMCWEQSKNIELRSLSIVSNSITLRNAALYAGCLLHLGEESCGTNMIGAGVYFGMCENVVLTTESELTISSNSISSVVSIALSNVILEAGGGLYAISCNGFVISVFNGILTVTNNSLSAIQSTGTLGMGLFASGIFISNSNNVTLVNEKGLFSVNKNSISSANNTVGIEGIGIMGGGVYCAISSSVVISNISVENNAIVGMDLPCGSAVPFLQGSGVYLLMSQSVRIRDTLVANNSITSSISCNQQLSPQHLTYYYDDKSVCPAYISEDQGVLSVAAPSSYFCQWKFQSSSNFLELSLVYKMNLLYLGTFSHDPTCSSSFLAIYDGSSSLSPLIGSYCSYSPTPYQLPVVHCSGGLCPNTTDIVGSSGVVTVRIVNFSIYPISFNISWSLVPRDMNQSFPVSNSTAGLLDIPSISGAGIALFGSKDIQLSNSAVIHNRINYTFLAFGAGISISSGSTMTVTNCTVSNNVAVGSVASAAGIGSLQSSTISVFQSDISSNVATGHGTCFWTDGVVQCPSSFGGGLAVTSSAVAELYDVTVSNNRVECDTVIGHPCIGRGGGAGVTANGTLQIYKSRLRQNTCYCRHDAGCATCLGGGVYGDDGLLDHSDASILSQNAVDGLGTGGGACLQGTVVSNMDNVTIEYNTAFEGGGIWITDMATMTMASCTLHNNTAGTVGGAMVASSSCVVNIRNTNMIDNHAPYAATIAGYFSINNIVMTIANSSIAGSTTNHIAVIGASNISVSYLCTENNTVWNAAFPNNGTGFASLSFIGCSQGSYSIGPASSSSAEKTECYACPLEANCDGDAIGVYARSGFWGMAPSSGGDVSMYACPVGYCCENETCAYDYCGGHRRGLLCGSCDRGSSVEFLSSQCTENGKCYHGYWAVPLLFCVSIIAIVGFALYSAHSKSSGLLSIPIFFYQATPLTATLGNQGAISGLTSIFHSVFGLSLQGNHSFGLCLFPNVTAASKLWMEMGAYLVVVAAIIPAFAVHRFVTSYRRWQMEEPTASRYVAIAVKIGEISYITWAVNTLQMQQCVYINRKWRWFFNAEDNGCLDESWQFVGLVLCLILGTIPFMISGMAMKWSTKDKGRLSEHESEICQVLVSPYKSERWWWCGISLGRRLLVSIAYSFTTTSNRGWRPAAMMMLCTAFLALDIWAKPFTSSIVQRIENVSLLMMSILTALSIPGLMLEQFGLQASEKQSSIVEAVQLVLFSVPGIAVAAIFTKRGIGRLREKLLARSSTIDGVELSLSKGGGEGYQRF